jgi:hypothetical protein
VKSSEAAIDFMAVETRLEPVPFQNNFKLTHYRSLGKILQTRAASV